MKPIFFLTAAFAISSNMAFAAVTAESIAADLQAKGFTRIEIQQSANQFKAEAFRGTEKFEAIYDASTGDVLKTESYNDDSNDSTDDADDDHGNGTSGSDHDGGDDNGGDHDGGDDNGGDHDGGDHDGGDHDGGDDD